jgi:hypothetical protein
VPKIKFEMKQVNVKRGLTLAIIVLLFTAVIRQNQHRFFTYKYEAPLVNKPENSGFELVPNAYTVGLQPGYMLDQHEATIGISLRSYINYVFDQPYREYVAYSAHDVHDTILVAIRADPGVAWVEVQRKPELEAAGME